MPLDESRAARGDGHTVLTAPIVTLKDPVAMISFTAGRT